MTAHGINTKVSKSGDTMTGDLSVVKKEPKLILSDNSTGNTFNGFVMARNNEKALWQIGGPTQNGHLYVKNLAGGNIHLTAERLAVENSLSSVTAHLFVGSGSPEGVVAAPPGSLYLNSNGGQGTTVYYKATGTGNTGWRAVA